MREKLADLRGKLVAWRGWETGSRHNRTWICVSKASITQWDGITPIQKSFNKNVIKVDHFWLTADQRSELHPQPITQYEKVGGLGVVKTYMRNDGTIDYTVRKPSAQAHQKGTGGSLKKFRLKEFRFRILHCERRRRPSPTGGSLKKFRKR